MITHNLTGHGGHTALVFKDDTVTIEWENSNIWERGSLRQIINAAKVFNFKVTGTKFDRGVGPKTGKVIMTATEEKVDMLAETFTDKELKDGKLLMEGQKDGTWKIIKNISELESPSKSKKNPKTRTSHRKLGGG